MVITYYRIYDATQDTIRANRIPEYEMALQTLELLARDYPQNTLELESYTENTVRKGFGRDPDLHT